MSDNRSGDDDRTRFRQVPRPGGKPSVGARGGAAAPAPQPGAQPSPQAAPARHASPPPRVSPPLPAVSLADFVGGGKNPLLAAATPLIALMGRTRLSATAPNIVQLREHAIREVHAFNERVDKLGVLDEIKSGARYALCCSVDQAVFSTPWGIQSGWQAQTLLYTFQDVTDDGETFFKILERSLEQPPQYADLIELQYVCLLLGYTGRYQAMPNGAAKLQDLRERLYRTLRDLRGAAPGALSGQWQGAPVARRRVLRGVPLWVIASVTAGIVFGTLIWYSLMLGSDVGRVSEAIAAIGRPAISYAATMPPASNAAQRLRELLSSDADQRVLVVEESPNGALVSLIANDLFASGSTTLNPKHEAAIRRVAAALNEVPGRVVVLGHTDDVPPRSLTLDNVALSRERAISVKNLLEPELRDKGRLAWAGLGASSPRYVPANLPNNRARNRRVEIQLQGS